MTRLGSDSPLSHRLTHRATDWGIVAAPKLWRIARRLAPIPAQAEWLPSSAVSITLLPVRGQGLADIQLYQGSYEWAERRFIRRLVGPGGRCVDVGANV